MTTYAGPWTQKSTIVRFFEQSVPGDLTPTWNRRRRRGRSIAPKIRTMQPDDTPLIEAMAPDVSERSLAQRFFVGTPTIPRGLIRQLRTVDHDLHEAVIALVNGRAIGLAQYVRQPNSQVAELAVLVADVWQGNGIGGRLITRLAELAASRGITGFEASVLPDNDAAHKALARLWPAAPSTESDDSVDYVLPLVSGVVSRAS